MHLQTLICFVPLSDLAGSKAEKILSVTVTRSAAFGLPAEWSAPEAGLRRGLLALLTLRTWLTLLLR
jgi:hypothetical protein